MLNFTPKTDEQLDQEGLIPEGVYDCEVEAALEGASKKGEPMLTLTVKVFVDDGSRTVKDWLVTSTRKFKQFCYAFGLNDRYDAGNVSAIDCVGVMGRCKVGNKPATDQFKASNKIDKYQSYEDAAAAAASAPPAAPKIPTTTQDDLPWS